MSKIKFMAVKELHHILRDPRSLAIVFVMPLMMTFLYGYAIDMDVENVIVAVKDFDGSRQSRSLVERIYASTYFSRPEVEVNTADPEGIFRSDDAHAVLIIRPGFGKAVDGGHRAALGLLVDGSDNNFSAAAQNYLDQTISEFFRDLLPVGYDPPGVILTPVVLYNPDLESSHFFVPGLVAIILIMVSALLTSITIAREKETGTLEQLLTAPVKPGHILIGKLIPYVFIAFFEGILVVLFARIIFAVPFVGSHLLMLGFGLVYVTTALAIGILISSLADTQQVAMFATLLSTMLPSVMLSGFIFAIKNMPPVLQGISYVIPARYFLPVIRGIMLKGADISVLAAHGLCLVVLMVIMMAVAARRFRTTIG